MRYLKKAFILFLITVFLMTSTYSAFSVDSAVDPNIELCTSLGIFKSSDGAAETKELTRIEAASLILRLLGKEEEAKAFIPPQGFQNYSDIQSLSVENKAIAAYLKANPQIGFTASGSNQFNPSGKMTSAQLYSILLIALDCAGGRTGEFTQASLALLTSGKEIIVASDRSPLEWRNKASFICRGGELPSVLRTAIKLGNAAFVFAPGEYLIEGATRSIRVGSNTTIRGAVGIEQPAKLQDMLYPNPAKQAVFLTRTALASTVECKDTQFGFIRTVPGAENVTISDIALSGYTVLVLDNAAKTSVSNVLIHNYRGTYPRGQWCNMGYGRATGSLWIYGNCSDIDIRNCQIQCSSHHGLTIHTGSDQFLSKNINIVGCRALYCGNGQLRGETGAEYNEAAIRVPETKGFGYLDWSVAFDLCENQSVENVTLEDCYALEAWKAGFYTEPEDTGGHIKNLTLKRCRSELGGQRALIPNSKPRATIPSETEACNFYVQGGYFEDCVSIQGEKCGWYLNPNRPEANPKGDGIIQLVRCGDMGSAISLVTEMTDSIGLHTDGFWSLNAVNHAMWLFGTSDFKMNNTTILSSNRINRPIKIGYMLRQQFRESRNPQNTKMVATGGKYDVIRVNMTDCKINGTVYNLPTTVNPVEIVRGSTFNGAVDPTRSDIGITLKRSTATLKTEDYTNRSLPKAWPKKTLKSPNRNLTVKDFAACVVNALKIEVKDGTRTLIAKLVASGAIPEAAAIKSKLLMPRGTDKTAVYVSKGEKFRWQDFGYSMGPNNKGKQKIVFDATLTGRNGTSSIAFADSSAKVAGINDLAIRLTLRHNEYNENTKYHFEIIADLNAKTYSVFVTPPGGQKTETGHNLAIGGTADDLGQVFFTSSEGNGLMKIQSFYISTIY